jgi:branched-chain amino acid transport system permease protein
MLSPEIQWMIYGVLMIVVLVFMPKGVVPSMSDLVHRRFSRGKNAKAGTVVRRAAA